MATFEPLGSIFTVEPRPARCFYCGTPGADLCDPPCEMARGAQADLAALSEMPDEEESCDDCGEPIDMCECDEWAVP